MARKKASDNESSPPAKARKAPAVKASSPPTARGSSTGKNSKSVPAQELIAKRAYELYVKRGRVDGFAEQDWRQAEQEMRSEMA